VERAPETLYVAVGDSEVAYKVGGAGPPDLLYFYGLGSHVDMAWESPAGAGFVDGLASFARVILFDRRGTGASDSVARDSIPTWEAWAEDIGAVLDAAESDRATIFAIAEAGPIAMVFAATQPERVSSLILANTGARFLEADDYPIGVSQQTVDVLVDTLGSLWGTAGMARLIAPARADDDQFTQTLARRLRAAATPRNAAAQIRYIMGSLDVRSALPLIQAPTLVLHTSHNPVVPVELGRYVAEHIAGAKFVEVPGRGAVFDDRDDSLVLGEIAEFLTGERPAVEVDRILTTVLFTDIVDSTRRAAALGDRPWRRLLDAHDRMVREQLRHFRGREIKTTGDGFLVAFDGPARGIRCTQAIIAAGRGLGVDIRAGLHTGECEVRGDDLAGLAVHVAARVGAAAGAGEVIVSSIVKDLVAGSGIEFADRGECQLKGVPGIWRLFAVAG
jgi:class 3 adenylate cyclase